MKIKTYINILILGLIAFSCTKDDGIFVEDHFFDYEIPLVPVESNYTVGAFYNSFTWNAKIPESPAVGTYNTLLGDAVAYAKHVDQAKKGGIDYFLFGLRSTKTMAQFTSDQLFINTLQSASNAGDMKFAISYNFGSMGLADKKEIETLSLVTVFLKDFELMTPFFKMGNYMKIDGKCIVYIQNSHNLFSLDNAALYKQLRTQMSGLGVQLYIIGMQNEWTPPLRYDFRFVNGVDALTHSTYANIGTDWYDRYLDIHKMCDQAWGYSKDKLAENGLEYIPTISPSINPQIVNASAKFYKIEKNKQWFTDMCNVARRTTGPKQMILLDSFNDWNRGTQIEAAASYGDEYLTILKEQFKVK